MDLNNRYSTADSMYKDLFLSEVKTVAVVHNRSFQSVGDEPTSNSTKAVGILATLADKTPVSNSGYDNSNSDISSSIVNEDNKKPNWLIILLITMLVGVGVASFFMVRKYVADTQAKLAQQEQQRLEMEARLEEERQRRLEEEQKRLDFERLIKEAEEKRLEEKRKKEERAKAEEKRREEERRREEEKRKKEKEKDKDKNPIEAKPSINKTIDIVKDLYRFINRRQYNLAKSLFANPELLNADFFNQFDRVTVENLQITEKAENYVKLKGINNYYYPDGSVQTESRSYTLEVIDSDWKMTQSDFLKVIKPRN